MSVDGWTHERLAADLDAAAPGAALLLRVALPGATGFLAERKRVACERLLDRLSAAVDESAPTAARMAIVGSMAALCMEGFLRDVAVLWSIIRATLVMSDDAGTAKVLLGRVGWKRLGPGEPLPLLAALGLKPGATKDERDGLASIVAAGKRPDLDVSHEWWNAANEVVPVLVGTAADLIDRIGEIPDGPHVDEPSAEFDDVAPTGSALPITLKPSGPNWLLAFKGEAPVPLPGLVGIAYIAALIDKPGEDVDAWRLTGHDADAEPLSGEPALDARTRREANRRVQEIGDQITEMESAGLVADARLTTELHTIQAYLAQSIDRRGEVRALGEEREKARKAALAAIRTAKQKIRDASPNAADYIEKRLTTGRTCRFDVDPATRVSPGISTS